MQDDCKGFVYPPWRVRKTFTQKPSARENALSRTSPGIGRAPEFGGASRRPVEFLPGLCGLRGRQQQPFQAGPTPFPLIISMIPIPRNPRGEPLALLELTERGA